MGGDLLLGGRRAEYEALIQSQIVEVGGSSQRAPLAPSHNAILDISSDRTKHYPKSQHQSNVCIVFTKGVVITGFYGFYVPGHWTLIMPDLSFMR